MLNNNYYSQGMGGGNPWQGWITGSNYNGAPLPVGIWPASPSTPFLGGTPSYSFMMQYPWYQGSLYANVFPGGRLVTADSFSSRALNKPSCPLSKQSCN